MKKILGTVFLAVALTSNINAAEEFPVKLILSTGSGVVTALAGAGWSSYAAGTGIIVLKIYAGVVSGGLVTATSAPTLERYRKEVQALVNNDVQNFYLNGEVSMLLKQSVEQVKLQGEGISDADAIDLIVMSVN